jgi:hypothetical protein
VGPAVFVFAVSGRSAVWARTTDQETSTAAIAATKPMMRFRILNFPIAPVPPDDDHGTIISYYSAMGLHVNIFPKGLTASDYNVMIIDADYGII